MPERPTCAPRIGPWGSGPWRGAGVWALFGLGFFGSLLSWVSIAGWISWAWVLVVEVPFIALFGAILFWAFQIAVLLTLVDTGVALLHAINERVAMVRQ